MKKIIRSLGLAAVLAGASAFAAEDVGLVNQLSGDVSYTSGSNTAKAKAFMKMREGDRFSIPAGAQLRIVYFDGGRQESYTGPAALTAGTKASQQHNGAQPQVTALPAGVPQKIAQTPELIQIARLGRSGGVAVRGAQEQQRLTPQAQAEVRQARQTYEQMRKSAAANDIVPEQYLYAVLQDHLLYDEMKGVVAEMQKRQPSNPDVAVMAEYVKVKTEPK
ncbi:MAG TPA: hypothetical protein VGO02_05295 [Burkholderiales bacterium]|jgi:hypothetical protein|nr:hypothetical protein [Burkholderiales bacterium]